MKSRVEFVFCPFFKQRFCVTEKRLKFYFIFYEENFSLEFLEKWPKNMLSISSIFQKYFAHVGIEE